MRIVSPKTAEALWEMGFPPDTGSIDHMTALEWLERYMGWEWGRSLGRGHAGLWLARERGPRLSSRPYDAMALDPDTLIRAIAAHWRASQPANAAERKQEAQQ